MNEKEKSRCHKRKKCAIILSTKNEKILLQNIYKNIKFCYSVSVTLKRLFNIDDWQLYGWRSAPREVKMKNKSTKATCRRGISLLAAAALTAALMGGQVYSVLAENTEKTTEINTLFPDNITISDPVALSEVSLPKSEYGTFTWADETFVPSKRVQSCEVFLKPFKDVDLSDRKGWDSKKEAVVGYVTVVVSSIEGDGSEEEAWEYEEYTQEEPNTEAESEDGSLIENTPQEGEDSQNAAEGEKADISQETGNTEGGVSEEQEASAETNANESTAGEEQETKPDVSESEGQEQKTDAPESENPAEEKEPSEDTQEEPANENDSSDETVTESPAEPTTAPEADTNTAETPSDTPENIFDREDIPEDNRSTEVKEEVSEEEILELSAVNHSCDGIYVSGIELPWYVQFRVTSGESYEFTNEKEASIFKSYEFKLWDLRNDTEYEIPDGEYISVTIPVKEGYEYTVEHILDNGAIETIIPSVSGNIMVFSTHSFSPFGIAGSKPILYPEIGEDVYDGATPTPTAVPTKRVTPTPAVSKITSAPTPATAASISSGNKNNSGTSGSTVINTGSSTGSSQNTVSGSNGTASGNPAAENTVSSQDTKEKKIVNTGDYTRILPFVILIAAAVVIIIVAVIFLKKRK